MKNKIVNFLKYNKTAYCIYFYLASFLVNIMKLFVKPNNKLILFNSFAGRKYDDSPKAIFEAIKNDLRFRDYKIIWAFHQPEKFQIEGAKKIKTDCLRYFKTALAARVWITNSSIERGLDFKGKNTFYINTWHGSPIKKMGSDIASDNQSFRTKSQSKIDIMNTQSRFEAEIFSKCFGISREKFLEVGLPRNDVLANYSEDKRDELKEKLGIYGGKKVILYCPTFREFDKEDDLGIVCVPPINLKKWSKELNNKYVLLFRAHYEVTKIMEIKEDNFIRDVTNYPSLNELMIISDILISDYSSIFFDYSIMDKCMLHFTYDYEKYEKNRGMYFDIRNYLNGSNSEDGLINILKKLEYQNEVNKTKIFRNKFLNFYGNATQKTVDCIAEHIMK